MWWLRRPWIIITWGSGNNMCPSQRQESEERDELVHFDLMDESQRGDLWFCGMGWSEDTFDGGNEGL